MMDNHYSTSIHLSSSFSVLLRIQICECQICMANNPLAPCLRFSWMTGQDGPTAAAHFSSSLQECHWTNANFEDLRRQNRDLRTKRENTISFSLSHPMMNGGSGIRCICTVFCTPSVRTMSCSLVVPQLKCIQSNVLLPLDCPSDLSPGIHFIWHHRPPLIHRTIISILREMREIKTAAHRYTLLFPAMSRWTRG